MNITQQFTTINGLVDSKKNKKCRLAIPTIRFSLILEKPSSEKFTEFNYNKLMIKVLKFSKKQIIKSRSNIINNSINESEDSNHQATNKEQLTTISKHLGSFPLLDCSFKIEKEEIFYLLSAFRDKIIIGKQLNIDNNQEYNDESINKERNAELYENDEFVEEETGDLSNEIDDIQDQENEDIKLPKKLKNKKSSNMDMDYFESLKYKYKDFSHLGKGYDGNDSFIDDSDAQDVQVPKNMAPKHGGFYVNKEKIKLEKNNFKPLHSKIKSVSHTIKNW